MQGTATLRSTLNVVPFVKFGRSDQARCHHFRNRNGGRFKRGVNIETTEIGINALIIVEYGLSRMAERSDVY